MLNSYLGSAVYLLRTNGSLPFHFNDFSCLLSERFDRNPSQTASPCCACCVCCAFPTHRLSINPGYLYGIRQSSLLQWSASRKLILGVDRYNRRIPVYDLDRDCYEVPCSLKERSIHKPSGIRRKESCCCKVQKGEIYDLSHLNEAEALLNLLSEEVDEEYVGGKSRNRISYKRLAVKRRGSSGRREGNVSSSAGLQLEKRGNCSSKCNSGMKKTDELRTFESKSKHDFESEGKASSSGRVQLEKSGNYSSKCNSGKKNTDRPRSFESNSKHQFESGNIQSREEDSGRNEEREALFRGDNRRGRKDGSSCSSYYSFSSVPDFDSETEVHDKYEQLKEESLTGHKDSVWKGKGRYDGFLPEKHNEAGDGEERHIKVSDYRNTAVGGVVERDWTCKSQKKLTNTLAEERQSSRESSQINTRVLESRESNYTKASNSYKRFSDNVENSALAVNLEAGTRKQYAHKGIQVDRVSKSGGKFPEHKEMYVIHTDDETTCQTQERLSGRTDNLEIAVRLVGEAKEDQCNTVSRLTEKDKYSGNGQSAEILETCKNNIKKTSIIQSETSINNQVRNTSLVSVSYAESADQYPGTEKKVPRRIQSRTGSNDVTDTTVVYGTDAECIPSSQGISENRIVDQEISTVLVGKLAGETRDGNKQTNGKFKQIESRKEDKRSNRPSTIHASSDLISQDVVQQRDYGDKRSSQAVIMPPSSQLIARSSSQDESTTGLAREEVFRTASERSSSSLSANSKGQPPVLHHKTIGTKRVVESQGQPLNIITPEDTLGSAGRIQKSSMQFVGDFVERMRHEVSSSEDQKVKKFSETKLTSEDKCTEKSLSQHGSEDFHSKEHHEAHSSRGSGTKGPSDEMWDVTDHSILKTPAEEEAEATATTSNAIVRRSGRSFWNVIADIVRLRWGSHSETPSSAARSGGNISLNDSVSSEALLSVCEPEDNKNKQIKDKCPQPETTSDQMQHKQLILQGQAEESIIMRSTDKIRYAEEDSPPSANIVEIVSTSGVSLPSSEGKLGGNEYGKSFPGTSSDMEIVGSSLPSAAGASSSTTVTEISTTVTEISSSTNKNASRSGLSEGMEQPAGANLNQVLGTEGKDGELKRRKLQRNKQVPKDRFDEWEEAYKLESEQRKIDEIFMREALLEAKKAADTWEVPVGAVLVQHGKIIARGCNL